MSLLQTKNSKFKIPFVFVAGALFLIFLMFFARYIEGYQESTPSKDFSKEKVVFAVKIASEETVYLEEVKIGMQELKKKFVSLTDSQYVRVKIQTYDFTSFTTLEIIKMLQEKNYQVEVVALSK